MIIERHCVQPAARHSPLAIHFSRLHNEAIRQSSIAHTTAKMHQQFIVAVYKQNKQAISFSGGRPPFGS